MTNQFYFLDPAQQEINETLISNVVRYEFFHLVAGSPASGKTTRLFRLQEELEKMGYHCL